MQNSPPIDPETCPCARTAQWVRDSLFLVHGFAESFFAPGGKFLGSVRHAVLPEGRTPGSSGEQQFKLPRAVHASRGFRDVSIARGTVVTSRIDTLCGRLKYDTKRTYNEQPITLYGNR